MIFKRITTALILFCILLSGSVFAAPKKDLNTEHYNSMLKKTNYKNLTAGEYNIDMTVMNYYEEDKISMMNEAVVNKKIIVDKDNKYWLYMELGPVHYKFAGKLKTGYLKEMYYLDGAFKEAQVISTQTQKNPMTGKNEQFPKEIKYPIENPTDLKQKTIIKVYVPMMEKLLGTEKGTRFANPTIDWSTFDKLN